MCLWIARICKPWLRSPPYPLRESGRGDTFDLVWWGNTRLPCDNGCFVCGTSNNVLGSSKQTSCSAVFDTTLMFQDVRTTAGGWLQNKPRLHGCGSNDHVLDVRIDDHVPGPSNKCLKPKEEVPSFLYSYIFSYRSILFKLCIHLCS